MYTPTILPYSAYRELPDDDYNNYEMLWGELHVSPQPRFVHQMIQANLVTLLGTHVREQRLGRIVEPIDLYLNELNYVHPDICFFRPDQVALLLGEQAVRLVPPLVIEILSPSSEKHDRERKRRWYADLGVREYWLVDIDTRRVEVIDLPADSARREDPVRSAVLPDLSLPLADIFA